MNTPDLYTRPLAGPLADPLPRSLPSPCLPPRTLRACIIAYIATAPPPLRPPSAAATHRASVWVYDTVAPAFRAAAVGRKQQAERKQHGQARPRTLHSPPQVAGQCLRRGGYFLYQSRPNGASASSSCSSCSRLGRVQAAQQDRSGEGKRAAQNTGEGAVVQVSSLQWLQPSWKAEPQSVIRR